jgi:hypothetical protein
MGAVFNGACLRMYVGRMYTHGTLAASIFRHPYLPDHLLVQRVVFCRFNALGLCDFTPKYVSVACGHGHHCPCFGLDPPIAEHPKAIHDPYAEAKKIDEWVSKYKVQDRFTGTMIHENTWNSMG